MLATAAGNGKAFSTKNRREIIGLVPAAGRAKRIAPLPCSKEIFPVGFQSLPGLGGARPKVAAHYLLERMKAAGADKAFVVLRKGKWDIPSYFGNGHLLDMHLAYLIMREPHGVPYTLEPAYPFIRSARILFGFPDILFHPLDAYAQLLKKMSDSGAEIVLGLFKAIRPEKMDMVELNPEEKVIRIEIKPKQTSLVYTWIAAAWNPEFTEFMHHYVENHAARSGDKTEPGKEEPHHELFIGQVIQKAITENMKTAVVRFDTGRFLDIGTPEDIKQAAGFF